MKNKTAALLRRIAPPLLALLTACALCACGAGVHVSVGTPGNNSFEWGISTPGGGSYGNAPAPGTAMPADTGELSGA